MPELLLGASSFFFARSVSRLVLMAGAAVDGDGDGSTVTVTLAVVVAMAVINCTCMPPLLLALAL